MTYNFVIIYACECVIWNNLQHVQWDSNNMEQTHKQTNTKNICVFFILYECVVTYSKNNALYWYVSFNSHAHDSVLLTYSLIP